MKTLGIITIIMGIVAITAPLITGLSVAVLVGLLVLAGGIARMVWAFQAASLGQGLLMFVIGGLTLLCGVALATDPIFASGVLTIILAAYLAIDGVVEIAAGLQVRPFPGWGWLVIGGGFSLLLGVMIWQQYPLSGAWAVGILVGIKILFNGWTMIALGMAARGAVAEATAS